MEFDPEGQQATVMMRQLKNWFHKPTRPKAASDRLRGDLQEASLSFEGWWTALLAQPRFYCDLTDAEVIALKARYPQAAAEVIACADMARQHRFSLLGAMDFESRDPDRTSMPEGYKPIDWSLDPVRALRFPMNVPHKDWDLYRMRPGNADVKYPWELARCQHWIWLGQAWRLTGDDAYAVEIHNQLADFVAANPVGIGVNWTCTMDVALRALNWSLGLSLIATAEPPADRAYAACAALYEHGVFIRANLEDKYEVTSNHFLSNVLGLLFVGHFFRALPAGRQWYDFACQALLREIDIQVLPDGADFESSVPYHRLVLELFMTGLRLTDHAATPLSAHYRARVGDMAAYLWSVLRPDGRLPQIGDADDGRVHVFSPQRVPQPQDGRHILGPAAALFGQSAWLSGAGPEAGWEAAWWGLAGEGRDELLLPVTKLFPEAGVFVSRHADTYLAVTNAIVGTKGFGNHKHNDQLGFEFHAGGVAWLVDPGSYVYTGDADARNRFRATSAHNTVTIDGAEQNHFNPEWLFRMFDPGFAPIHAVAAATEEGARYVGRHGGYRRNDPPVEHERQFRLLHEPGVLMIADRFRGQGVHRLDWTFQCGPGVNLLRAEPDVVWLAAGDRRMTFGSMNGLEMTLEDGAYSPSYGVRQPAPRIRCSIETTLADDQSWCFVIAPPDWLQNEAGIACVADFVSNAKESWR